MCTCLRIVWRLSTLKQLASENQLSNSRRLQMLQASVPRRIYMPQESRLRNLQYIPVSNEDAFPTRPIIPRLRRQSPVQFGDELRGPFQYRIGRFDTELVVVGVPDVRVPNGLIPSVGPAVEHSEVPFSQSPFEYDAPLVQGYSRTPQRLREYGGCFPGADEVGREYRHASIVIVSRGFGRGSDVLGGEGVPRRLGLLPSHVR